MAVTSDIKSLLERMNPAAWRASELAQAAGIPTIGDIANRKSVSGTLVLTGFSDGDWRQYEITHAGTAFYDNPMPVCGDAPGFIIMPVLSCDNPEGYRVYVLYDADEYVYITGGEPGAGGAANVAWTRKGTVV